MRIVVDGKAFDVNENEFLQFHADCVHGYQCLGEKTATAIMQISYLS